MVMVVYATIAKGWFDFGKTLGSLSIPKILHKVGYILLHARPMVPT
jgi:hypothetical protein